MVLPIELIQRLDQALLRRLGGFETRAEFVREAVENMLLELSYEPAPPEPLQEKFSNSADANPDAASNSMSSAEPFDLSRATLDIAPDHRDVRERNRENRLVDQPSDLSATVLTVTRRGAVIQDGVAKVEDEPLFGLHNRDYPSMWAAHQLASLTREELVPFADYLDEVARRAWEYAEQL